MPPPGTILIVDDSRDDVDLLLRTFEKLGIGNPVHACEGADSALAYLETHELPAIMLLDLKMPIRDGFYVLHQVKTRPEWKDLIVIVLTTSSDLGDIRMSYELGANSFLTKPFDLTEFRLMVSAFHQYWVLQNKAAPKRGRTIDKPSEQ
jgi:CheY-like chemotaxis protein